MKNSFDPFGQFTPLRLRVMSPTSTLLRIKAADLPGSTITVYVQMLAYKTPALSRFVGLRFRLKNEKLAHIPDFDLCHSKSDLFVREGRGL